MMKWITGLDLCYWMQQVSVAANNRPTTLRSLYKYYTIIWHWCQLLNVTELSSCSGTGQLHKGIHSRRSQLQSSNSFSGLWFMTNIACFTRHACISAVYGHCFASTLIDFHQFEWVMQIKLLREIKCQRFSFIKFVLDGKISFSVTSKLVSSSYLSKRLTQDKGRRPLSWKKWKSQKNIFMNKFRRDSMPSCLATNFLNNWEMKSASWLNFKVKKVQTNFWQ